MTSLRSDIWCAAFVRRHNDAGRMCVVARKGHPVAGQIWVEIDHLNGEVSLFTPAPALARLEGEFGQVFECRYDRTDAATVKARIEREIKFDPDFWVIVLESRSGEHGLDLAEES
jgi:hypothetical protein